MMTGLLTVVLLLGPQEEAARLRELLHQLGSESIEQREAAKAKLEQAGKAALPLLEEASKSADPEIAAVARELFPIMAVRVQFSGAFLELHPDAPKRLAHGSDGDWFSVFLKASRSSVPETPSIPRSDWDLLLKHSLNYATHSHLQADLCKEIAYRGLRQALPSLRRHLKEGETPTLRAEAARGLAILGDRKSISAMTALLSEEEDEFQDCIAWILHALNAREALPEVKKRLSDENCNIRANAVRILGLIGEPEDVPRMIVALKDPESRVRALAIGALEHHDLGGAANQIVMCLEDPSSWVRSAAAGASRRWGLKEAVPGLARLISDEHYLVRAAAIRALASLDARDLSRAIVPCLKDEKSLVRSAAAKALVRFQAVEAIPILRTMLEKGTQTDRRMAFSALVALEGKAFIPRLKNYFKDPDSSIRSRAVDAVATLDARLYIPDLLDQVRTPSDFYIHPGSRAMAALVEMGVGDVIPAVRARLGDRGYQSWYVADQLSRLDPQAAMPVLEELLEAENASLVGHVAGLMVRNGRSPMDPLIQKRLAKGPEEVRRQIAEELCEAGHAEGVPILIRLTDRLSSLNGVRRPKMWSQIHVELPGGIERVGLWEKHLVRDASEHGLKVEGLHYLGARFDGYQLYFNSLGATGGKLIWNLRRLSKSRCEFILEEDRIRILPRWKAREFWVRWWKEKKAQDN